MKLLLVMDSADQYDQITGYVKKFGFDTIWYRYVLKAMDNLEEIDPDGIFISAVDFPRHWKTIIAFFRSTHSESESPVVIIHGPTFSDDDSQKARYMNVNCLLPDSFVADGTKLDSLYSVLKAALGEKDLMKNVEPARGRQKQLSMVITNPLTGALVPGKVKKITHFGVVFHSAYLSLLKNIERDTILSSCSLRVGGTIISPACKVVNNGDTLSLDFVSFEQDEKTVLDKFLTNIC
ncbi:hypothetical protein FACS1894102_4310 [Spirochaetia bacterium]|nr:hypothetical protein FACS1894102_4310 [Spirochaetia bacterium]